MPVTDEDRLKSKIYHQLESTGKLSYLEYIQLCGVKYEQEKHAKKPSKFNPKTTLDEKLLSLAYSYHRSNPNKRREIDARALKAIKKHNRCKGTDKVARHFFRVYTDTKRAVADFLLGRYCIEYMEEDGTLGEYIPENLLSSSLEDSLVKLAEEYEQAPDARKRKIDSKAWQMIRRCSSCKNSALIARSYYRIYFQMTGRGRTDSEKQN